MEKPLFLDTDPTPVSILTLCGILDLNSSSFSFVTTTEPLNTMAGQPIVWELFRFSHQFLWVVICLWHWFYKSWHIVGSVPSVGRKISWFFTAVIFIIIWHNFWFSEFDVLHFLVIELSRLLYQCLHGELL